jgi:hypothetical protein
MASQQRDYILRLIEQLRQFLSQIVRLRENGHYDEAFAAIIRAQERLLSLPSTRFLGAGPDEHFTLLTRGETPENAREKCLVQSDLLAEVARIYADKEQPALASGAWRFIHHLLELTAAKFPDTPAQDLSRRLDEASRQMIKDAA